MFYLFFICGGIYFLTKGTNEKYVSTWREDFYSMDCRDIQVQVKASSAVMTAHGNIFEIMQIEF